ncbi:hypothetical protein B0H34DRAFT_699007 [Crassisporium funariophilum]|nr:hypothetical protein B0H34DRAFT_699007 [Crassisporium funariophilum]
MASRIRRKPQLTYKSPSAGDNAFFKLSLPTNTKNEASSSTIANTTTSSVFSNYSMSQLNGTRRLGRYDCPMSPPLPLFHPLGRLAMSLPPLDPTLFGLPMPAIQDEIDRKSSARLRRPTAKLREVKEEITALSPTVSTIAAVAAREMKERPSPRKRRAGGAKRKRKDVDDGDASYPAKRTRMPRGAAGQAVDEDVIEAGLPKELTPTPETFSDPTENLKRRSGRSRGSTKRRDSSASETASISPSTNQMHAPSSGVEPSSNSPRMEKGALKSANL